MGEIKDLFGKTLSEYFAVRNGKVLYHTSSLAINAGDPIIAYAWWRCKKYMFTVFMVTN